MNAHIAGQGDLEKGDPIIAGAPGPDSDEWSLGLNVYPRPDVTAAFHIVAMRRGEGNDFREWVRPMDPSPPFPLGVVERMLQVGASITWELSGNSSISIMFSRAYVENQHNISNQDENSSAFRVAGSLDL